jgi:hypothetical protein
METNPISHRQQVGPSSDLLFPLQPVFQGSGADTAWTSCLDNQTGTLVSQPAPWHQGKTVPFHYSGTHLLRPLRVGRCHLEQICINGAISPHSNFPSLSNLDWDVAGGGLKPAPLICNWELSPAAEVRGDISAHF